MVETYILCRGAIVGILSGQLCLVERVRQNLSRGGGDIILQSNEKRTVVAKYLTEIEA